MYSQLTDRELVCLLTKNEDEEAFCELYIRYRKRLFLFCVSLVKVSEIAEDIVQDIFTTIWVGRRSLNPDLSFSSYIYTIARNQTLNFLREVNKTTKMKHQLLESAILIDDATDANFRDHEYARLLEKAISELSPLRQRIFRLSREEGLSHKEIAQHLNISMYTVLENISIALKHIKKYLNRYIDLSMCISLIICNMQNSRYFF